MLAVLHGGVYGGAHNQLARLRPGLAGAGFVPVAVVPPEAEPAAQRLEDEGIEVVRLPLESLRASADPRVHARSVLQLRRDVAELRRAIRGLEVDVVQPHGVINPHAGLAAAREPVAVTWQLLDSRAPMALRRAIMPAVTRIADSITSWGRRLARAHPGALSLGERCVLIYPPVDPALARDDSVRAAARERLAIPPGAVVIGTVGVRNSHKGHQFFVRAAAQLASEHRDTAFRVIGAPSPRHAAHMAAIEAEAARLGLGRPAQIEFVDPGGEATRLLQALDIFVLTSIRNSEGMPTAILEAMACAQPIVAVDVGSVGELVEDGVTGLVVPPEDPEAIAAAISRLLADADLRERLGAAGRKRAEREFPLDHLVERHAHAYRLALAHRARR